MATQSLCFSTSGYQRVCVTRTPLSSLNGGDDEFLLNTQFGMEDVRNFAISQIPTAAGAAFPFVRQAASSLLSAVLPAEYLALLPATPVAGAIAIAVADGVGGVVTRYATQNLLIRLGLMNAQDVQSSRQAEGSVLGASVGNAAFYGSFPVIQDAVAGITSVPGVPYATAFGAGYIIGDRATAAVRASSQRIGVHVSQSGD